MKIRYCWRCRMDVPMLEGEEVVIAKQLYSEAFKPSSQDIPQRFQKLIDYYNDLTGSEETVAGAIMHHFADQYGPDCEKCGKPYRTSKASFCERVKVVLHYGKFLHSICYGGKEMDLYSLDNDWIEVVLCPNTNKILSIEAIEYGELDKYVQDATRYLIERSLKRASYNRFKEVS